LQHGKGQSYNMPKDKLVWYVAYGSNLLEDRFSSYIIGGQPEGAQKIYDGCRDKTLPSRSKPKKINYEIYFAKNSSVWENGGVCFLNTNNNKSKIAYTKMYLVTRQQIEDIAKQETNSTNFINIDFEESIKKGYSIFKRPSWYGKLLFLGYNCFVPMFTLTNENNDLSFSKPSISYLLTIIEGIKQTFGIKKSEIVNYLSNKNGILGEYTVDDLNAIIDKNS